MPERLDPLAAVALLSIREGLAPGTTDVLLDHRRFTVTLTPAPKEDLMAGEEMMPFTEDTYA